MPLTWRGSRQDGPLRGKQSVASFATDGSPWNRGAVPSLFIDGQWVTAAAGGLREVRCPYDQAFVATVDEAGPIDTVRAIEAARKAFDEGPWPHVPAGERGALLLRVADLLVRDRAEIARAESLDTGKRYVE